jgi:hypothetical protein
VLIAKIQHGAPHPQSVLETFTNPGDESDNELEGIIASGFESEEEEVAFDSGSRMGDVEWIAFEVFQEDDSDNEDDEEDSEDSDSASDLVPALSALRVGPSPIASSPPLPTGTLALQHHHSSLSLLEYVLRLAALQTFEQQSHMSLTDEHIVMFLRDDNPASRQPALGPERASRRRSSQTSLSSDFSVRIHHTGHQLPISPHSEELEQVRHGTTPTSSSPTPSEKLAENPVNRNLRTQLERVMAQDYDPMTLVTPIVGQRVTRHKLQKISNIAIPKRKSRVHNSNSAPNSSQKKFSAPIGQNSGDVNDNNPLAGKAKTIPGRRAVSAAANIRKA